MIRIIEGRATGKTERLIRLAVENGYDIAAPTHEMAKIISYNAALMGLPVTKDKVSGGYRIGDTYILSVSDLVDHSRRKPGRTVVIDELEKALRILLPRTNIAGYTISDDELPDGGK